MSVSHVAKLILYTSLSLMCISNRNQKFLQQKTIFHNGFSDYFLLCSKRVAFIHGQRSDGRQEIRPSTKRQTLFLARTSLPMGLLLPHRVGINENAFIRLIQSSPESIPVQSPVRGFHLAGQVLTFKHVLTLRGHYRVISLTLTNFTSIARKSRRATAVECIDSVGASSVV